MNAHINIGQFATRRADLHAHKQVVSEALGGQQYSYLQFNERVNRLCAALSALELEQGERVALLLYNGHEFLESFFAIAKAGLVAVPINWRLTAPEIDYILSDCGVRCLFFDSACAATVAELARGVAGMSVRSWIEVRGEQVGFARGYESLLAGGKPSEPTVRAGGDDNLFIMYTSGTTGLPKGAVHTHNTVFWSAVNYSVSAGMHFDDRHLVFLPLFHIAALIGSVAALYNGNSLVVLRSFDPQESWRLIVEERIATSFAVPAMLSFMLQVPDFANCDWSSLRWFMSGGASLPVEIIEAYGKVGINVLQAFGMTEACGMLCLLNAEDGMRKAGSVGKPLFHSEVRIVGPDDQGLPAGEAGEILARSPTIMKEYWNLPEATAEAMRGGWYHTGDVGVRDEDGFITIKDRIRDMVISGGENVYPAEVEMVLMQHPDILEAAVIGMNSDRWGESPFAVIVRKSPGLDEAAVLAHCNGKLARFKLPKGVAFVDELPRNATGKVLKRLLRERFPGAAGG